MYSSSALLALLPFLPFTLAGVPHPAAPENGVIWSVSDGQNGIGYPYYWNGIGEDPCAAVKSNYDVFASGRTVCGYETGKGGGVIVALDETVIMGDPNTWCGREVQITDPWGKPYTFSGGPLVIGEACAGCVGQPIVDLSSIVNTELAGGSCANTIGLQTEGVSIPPITIEVLENVVPGFEYAGTAPPVNPATDAHQWSGPGSGSGSGAGAGVSASSAVVDGGYGASSAPPADTQAIPATSAVVPPVQSSPPAYSEPVPTQPYNPATEGVPPVDPATQAPSYNPATEVTPIDTATQAPAYDPATETQGPAYDPATETVAPPVDTATATGHPPGGPWGSSRPPWAQQTGSPNVGLFAEGAGDEGDSSGGNCARKRRRSRL
ncbi:uncharacterized protein I303_106661 [Kwoniella dejecticola CBS 10117]|uniref:Barwin domain-containing protein n=1 Tax=Kwoniella dejecticola CBS 10117 TaxID=1296121 RepID=A0A1A5ZU48_9TREE|nr:uncharacterized protein I303_08696 [Kwoniella dejecticola CBS 10117]OBR81310.1 hypothetical protein I303_08696 [Kwoniella dejecticola CBS 10117]